MVFKKPNYDFSEDNAEDMPYDLRQIYANLVGTHILIVSSYRNNLNFKKWFESLENLYVIVAHKLKAEKEYAVLKLNAINTFKKYETTYLLTDLTDEEGTGKIGDVLRELEMFLWQNMDDKNIFGHHGEDEGL